MNTLKMKITGYDEESNSLLVAFASDDTASQNPESYPSLAYQPLTMWPDVTDIDILKKNIVFDGCRLRLIDHELSLVIGTELRVTFPWVAPEDLIQKQISEKTDLICLKAMRLRLFEYEKYREFRELQTELISAVIKSNT